MRGKRRPVAMAFGGARPDGFWGGPGKSLHAPGLRHGSNNCTGLEFKHHLTLPSIKRQPMNKHKLYVHVYTSTFKRVHTQAHT